MGPIISKLPGGVRYKKVVVIGAIAIDISDPRFQHACSGRNITWNYINNHGVLPWPYTECPDSGYVTRQVRCTDPLPHCNRNDWEILTNPPDYTRNHWDGMGDPLKAPNPPPWFPHDGIHGTEKVPIPDLAKHPTKRIRVPYWTAANGQTWHCDWRCQIVYKDPLPNDADVGRLVTDSYEISEQDYDCALGCRNPSTYNECVRSCSKQHENEVPESPRPAHKPDPKPPFMPNPEGPKSDVKYKTYHCEKGCIDPATRDDCNRYCTAWFDQPHRNKRNLPGIPQALWNTTLSSPQVWHAEMHDSASNLPEIGKLEKSDTHVASYVSTGILIGGLILTFIVLLTALLYRLRGRRSKAYRIAEPQFSDCRERDTAMLELEDFCDDDD